MRKNMKRLLCCTVLMMAVMILPPLLQDDGQVSAATESLQGYHVEYSEPSTGFYYTGYPFRPAAWPVGESDIPPEDYVVSYRNNINVGTATITITGKNNYSGTISTTFRILPDTVYISRIGRKFYPFGNRDWYDWSPELDYCFTGKRICPPVEVRHDRVNHNVVLKKGTDYTLTYRDNINVGYGTVIAAGKGNFKDTHERAFKIIPDKVSIRVKNVKKIGRKTGMTLKPSKSICSPTTYQFQIAKDANFKHLVKTKKVSYAKIKKKKFKLKYKIKLKKGKRYYMRVRAVKKAKVSSGSGTETFYGPWSKTTVFKGK